jgi:hypothetical protein
MLLGPYKCFTVCYEKGVPGTVENYKENIIKPPFQMPFYAASTQRVCWKPDIATIFQRGEAKPENPPQGMVGQYLASPKGGPWGGDVPFAQLIFVHLNINNPPPPPLEL